MKNNTGLETEGIVQLSANTLMEHFGPIKKKEKIKDITGLYTNPGTTNNRHACALHCFTVLI